MKVRMVGFVGVLIMAGSLSVACSATPVADPKPVISPPGSPSSPPSKTPITPIPSPAAEMVADQFVSDNIPIDGGSREFATGVTTVGEDGVPRSYVAAEGDVFGPIADRFGLTASYLVTINAVRRDNVMILYAGDTINLDAHTITTVGDQNGVAYDHLDRLPQPYPPQEG